MNEWGHFKVMLLWITSNDLNELSNDTLPLKSMHIHICTGPIACCLFFNVIACYTTYLYFEESLCYIYFEQFFFTIFIWRHFCSEGDSVTGIDKVLWFWCGRLYHRLTSYNVGAWTEPDWGRRCSLCVKQHFIAVCYEPWAQYTHNKLHIVQ